MPIKTRLVMLICGLIWRTSRLAHSICATISPVLRFFSKPSVPVAQNTQPIAQPAWVEMQTVARSGVDHQHRLNDGSVIEFKQGFAGHACVGVLDVYQFEATEPGFLGKPFAQGGGQVGCLCQIVNPVDIQLAVELAGPKGRLLPIVQQLL